MILVASTDVVEVEEAPLTMDDLTYFWLESGAPCFIGNVKDICDHVERLGFQVYYVMSEEKYTYEENKVQKTAYRPQIFKVVNNFVGRAVSPAPNAIQLDTMQRAAWFALPKIPWDLVEKMDRFFRRIEDKHSTEAIVLLTYDSEKSGPEGWGVLVPKQANTAANCDYEADSVADLKPDHVYIVGSAHSHPGMAAYASGTDHKDQADFDGLHITYGWLASKGNVTEYHIELQMAGSTFIFNPSQVFEDAPKPEIEDEDIEEWEKLVSKKVYSSTTPKSSTTGGFNHFNSASSAGNYGRTTEQSRIKAPKDCPDVTKNIVVGVITDEDKVCPWCEFVFVDADINNRKCLTCHQYICFENEGLDDIVARRENNGVYTQDIVIDRTPAPSKAIYMWRREGVEDSYELIYDPAKVASGK